MAQPEDQIPIKLFADRLGAKEVENIVLAAKVEQLALENQALKARLEKYAPTKKHDKKDG